MDWYMALFSVLFLLILVCVGRWLNDHRNIVPFVSKDITGHRSFLREGMVLTSAGHRIENGLLWHASHRGSAVSGPENTIIGFQKCVEPPISTQLLEFDVRVTKDKKLILLHDAALDRTTNIKGVVSSFLLEDLLSADAGYHYSEDKINFPLRGTGITIPLLTDLLDITQNHPNVYLMFDVKDIEAVEPVLEIIKQRKLEKRVVLGAVEESINKKLRQRKPQEIPLCSSWILFFLVPILHFFGLLWLFTFKHEIYLGIGMFTSPRLVKALHTRGIRVGTHQPALQTNTERIETAVFQPFISWDTKEWHETCKSAGTDFIITDRPEALRNTLGHPSHIKQH